MADTTAPLPSPIPTEKKPNGNTGRKPSEKQLEALRADEMVAFGRTEVAKWADLVRRSGAQVD